MATSFSKQAGNLNLEPVDRLKTMLKELCNVAVANEKLIRFMVTQGIMSGDMHASLYLIPALKEIFGVQKEEIELRVIALQILQPLQVGVISSAAFRMYSGFDLYDTGARNKFIDKFDQLIKTAQNTHTEIRE